MRAGCPKSSSDIATRDQYSEKLRLTGTAVIETSLATSRVSKIRMSERNYCSRKSLLLRVRGGEGINIWEERKEELGATYGL